MRYNAYYNGKFTSVSKVRIPLTDRAVYFGDGIYDAVLGKDEKCFLLEYHLKRLFSNAEKMNLSFPIEKDALLSAIQKLTCRVSGYFFLYIQLTRTGKERRHSYSDAEKSNLLITVTATCAPNAEKTVSLIGEEDIRYFMCDVKTINLIPAVIASHKAEMMGADEAVFHRGETVTECAHSNVYIIKHGTVYTHPNSNLILPGIERMHLMSVCKRLDIPCVEKPFTLSELREADEALITSTSKLGLRAASYEDIIYPTPKSSVGKEICQAMLRDFEIDRDFSL